METVFLELTGRSIEDDEEEDDEDGTKGRRLLPSPTTRRPRVGVFRAPDQLWKRYWAWELVWLVYGVVNTLAITFIANEAGRAAWPDRGRCPGSPCSC